MSPLDKLSDFFYELVLKKSIDLNIKSLDCYLELGKQGQELLVSCSLMHDKPGLVKEAHRSLPYFQTKNCAIDTKNKQLFLIKKFAFGEMSPESFALTLLQFHSEVLKIRSEMRELSLKENAYIKKNCST